jgi:hypothetical protein
MRQLTQQGIHTMVRFSLALTVGLWAAGLAPAGVGVDSLFDELHCDFGSVPRGPMLTHPFQLTNRTNQNLHIAGVRVSCGCTSASAVKTSLAPGESTAIMAQMDTRRFVGPKTVTIYVTFDQPQWEEARLWVSANSRDDFAMNPDTLNFGQVKRGASPEAATNVTFYGYGYWQISEARGESNYVQTKVNEVRRDGAEVTYQVLARLRSDTPVGKWYTDVWLTTNHPALPRLRVPLTVEIESALSVSPNIANLGQIKSGEVAERRVIVRGVKPFRITSVQGTDDQVSVKDSAPDSKPVHVLTVKLKAAKPGELRRTLKILTDLKEDNEVDLPATADVTP